MRNRELNQKSLSSVFMEYMKATDAKGINYDFNRENQKNKPNRTIVFAKVLEGIGGGRFKVRHE
jgi:hypothetical protein